MFKKGRFDFWKCEEGIQGEIRIITDNLLAFQRTFIELCQVKFIYQISTYLENKYLAAKWSVGFKKFESTL